MNNEQEPKKLNYFQLPDLFRGVEGWYEENFTSNYPRTDLHHGYIIWEVLVWKMKDKNANKLGALLYNCGNTVELTREAYGWVIEEHWVDTVIERVAQIRTKYLEQYGNTNTEA